MKVKNRELEKLTGQGARDIMARPLRAKTAYWIARILTKCESEGRPYFEQKKALIEKHAKRHQSDGSIERAGKVLRKWAAGDIVTDEHGVVEFNDMAAYLSELGELQEIEIEIPGLSPVVIDLDSEPNLTPQEIMPFMAFIKDEGAGE